MKTNHFFRHSVDFLLLAVIVGLGLAGVLYFRFDTSSQIAVVLLMTVFYVFWGVYHHFHEGDLSGEVFLEYVGMAALVAFVLILFLLRV